MNQPEIADYVQRLEDRAWRLLQLLASGWPSEAVYEAAFDLEGTLRSKPARNSYVEVGLLINGVEFIPQDIVEAHTPFAVPANVSVRAVFVRRDDDA